MATGTGFQWTISVLTYYTSNLSLKQYTSYMLLFCTLQLFIAITFHEHEAAESLHVVIYS